MGSVPGKQQQSPFVEKIIVQSAPMDNSKGKTMSVEVPAILKCFSKTRSSRRFVGSSPSYGCCKALRLTLYPRRYFTQV